MLPDLPPQNLNAEQQTIGCMLLDNSVVDDVLAIVRTDSFYAETHQTIFAAILSMRSCGHSGIDLMTLADALEKSGELQKCGGPAYLLEILETVPHAVHAKYYAGIVREKHRHRQAVFATTEALRKLREPTGEDGVTEILCEAEQLLHRAIEDGQTDEPQSIGDALPDALEALSCGRGMQATITSGYESIDNHLGGIPQGALTVVAARPSLGKTSLMLGMAHRIAESGVPVLFVSYEQKKLELTARLVSLASGVSLTKLQRGGLTQADNGRIVEAGSFLSHIPLYIDDTCRDESTIAAMIRLQVRRRRVRVVVVDYLQLITPTDRKAIREQQVASISRTLKLVAMQMDVAIVVASQLNRQVEQREDKRPRLSDLRESGAIEQDADVVTFLHRPNKDNPMAVDDHAELIIGKNRNGPCGMLKLGWHPNCARYSDYSLIDSLN